ncbi:MAG: hypothetical protein QXP80_04715 [Zestosphaera sp.]
MKCRIAKPEELESVPGYVLKHVRKDPKASLLVCSGDFDEVFLISGELARLVKEVLASGLTPYSAGLYVGRVRRGRPRFVPSVNLLQDLYREADALINALVVSQEGVKPFLYGGDILKKSVIECHPPVERGEVVSVLDADMHVYGLGISRISGCEELGELRELDVVAVNMFDVGWYIRGEAYSERKYKA